MTLNTVWFILVAILFTGFFFLEGFDYGVGIWLPFLGRDDLERRGIINDIGPVWDGNEVWMITAGGALFASFPQVYATLFSGFYLALILMLVALILRGVAFEFRGKREDKGWRTLWDWAIFIGSLLPALLWGVTVANLMRGFAIQQDMNYYGGLLPLLNPYALMGGLVFVALFLFHGANFLTLKAPEEIAQRARQVSRSAWIVATCWVAASTSLRRCSRAASAAANAAPSCSLSLRCSSWCFRSLASSRAVSRRSISRCTMPPADFRRNPPKTRPRRSTSSPAGVATRRKGKDGLACQKSRKAGRWSAM